MKKLAIVLLALVFALGMAFTAQAANQINVKTTSEPITKTGCEKNGSIQFTFDAGSVLSAGYWWIIDLPLGAVLCQNIDFVINAGAWNTPFGALGVLDGTTTSLGYVKVKDVGGNALNDGVALTNGTGVFFRVKGPAGSQRVTVTVGNPAAGDWDTALDVTADAIEVMGNSEFTLTLFDQTVYSLAPIWAFEDIDNGAAGTPPDGIYGNGSTTLELLEVVDNTLCVNAQNLTGNYVNVSLDSRDDVWNFTGDNEVAHVMAANVISLANCKGATTGNVALGAQGACSFDYEAAASYCTTPAFTGNQIIVTNNNTWDDADYTLKYTIVSPTTGVYWGGAPAAGVPAFTAAQDPCAVAGTAVTGTGWTAYKADGVTTVAAFNGATCSVTAPQMATVLQNTFGKTYDLLNILNTFSKFYVNLPTIVYDSSVVTNGTNVIIQVDLIKEPCGVIFTGTRTVATIVSTCAAAAPVIAPITLQYFTNPSSQWWAGFAIANNSDTAGTVNLAVYEEDGDVGTVNNVAIAARGSDGCLGVWLTTELFTLLTPAAGNAGQLGDARFFMLVTPDVAGMEAFVMMGDGSQAMGYVKP